MELWAERLEQSGVGKELTEEFCQKSFLRHWRCHVQLEFKQKLQTFPLCGRHHGRKEGCAPGVKSGEKSEKKKLGVDCLADIPTLSHEHIFVQGSPELFCSPSSPWNLLRVPLVIFSRFHWSQNSQRVKYLELWGVSGGFWFNMSQGVGTASKFYGTKIPLCYVLIPWENINTGRGE